MINALVTLRIEFFWQSVASGVVIILSVAAYAWLQKKDRDGAGSIGAALANPDNRKILALALTFVAVLAVLMIAGALLATAPAASG